MTNFEKIRKGTAEELAELLVYPCKNCAYDKTDLCFGRIKNCSDGVLKWLNKKATPELTQTEREICVGLKHMGYEYIARDEDNRIYVYSGKPEKRGIIWNSDIDEVASMRILNETFDFIQWENEEPTSIDDLLEG